jgi:hypothetical protein
MAGTTHDIVRDGGIAPGLSISSVFPGLQNRATPEGLLHTIDKAMANYGSADGDFLNDLLETLDDPKLKDNRKLSRSELMQVMADIGDRSSPVEPAAAIRQQAAGVLERQHIDDPTGQIATGLAKFSVSEAMAARLEAAPQSATRTPSGTVSTPQKP